MQKSYQCKLEFFFHLIRVGDRGQFHSCTFCAKESLKQYDAIQTSNNFLQLQSFLTNCGWGRDWGGGRQSQKLGGQKGTRLNPINYLRK